MLGPYLYERLVVSVDAIDDEACASDLVGVDGYANRQLKPVSLAQLDGARHHAWVPVDLVHLVVAFRCLLKCTADGTGSLTRRGDFSHLPLALLEVDI